MAVSNGYFLRMEKSHQHLGSFILKKLNLKEPLARMEKPLALIVIAVVEGCKKI